MKIIVDNIEKKYNKSFNSFHNFITELNKETEALGRVVVKLFVDGKELEDIENIEVGNIKVVEVISKKTNILLIETLRELENYIDKFLDTIQIMTEEIDRGYFVEAIEKLLDGINGIEWIYGVLENSEEILGLEDEKLDKLFEEANVIMTSLIWALESKSYDDIKEELNCNLYDLLVRIKEIIPDLSQKAFDLEKSQMYSN